MTPMVTSISLILRGTETLTTDEVFERVNQENICIFAKKSQ